MFAVKKGPWFPILKPHNVLEMFAVKKGPWFPILFSDFTNRC